MIAPRTVTSSLIFHQGRPRLGFFLENGGTEDERQGRRRPSVRRDFPVGITDRMAKSGVTDRETNQPRPRCADLAGFEDIVRGADLRSAPSPSSIPSRGFL